MFFSDSIHKIQVTDRNSLFQLDSGFFDHQYLQKKLINPIVLPRISHQRNDKSKNNAFVQRLRKKCPYSELFWSAFSRIRTDYGEIPAYSVRMRENADHNNSEYGHFSRSTNVANFA